MKNILITGANSYIGTSVEKWLQKFGETYKIDTLDMKENTWREYDFSKYDVVFHVAGIAHVTKNKNLKNLYDSVNTVLTAKTALKAKKEGVRQFIFMSSIIVYGDAKKANGIIKRDTIPKPNNIYAESKLNAEIELNKLEDDNFKVVILRPPMIYGKGARGNYPKLSKFVLKTPIFPDYKNSRSMLHIDNLCEFIRLIIDNQESGIFYPQNSEYVCTTKLANLIAEFHGKNLRKTKIFNLFIKLLLGVDIVNKMFGDLVYDIKISKYEKGDYQLRNLKDSIELTETRIGNE